MLEFNQLPVQIPNHKDVNDEFHSIGKKEQIEDVDRSTDTAKSSRRDDGPGIVIAIEPVYFFVLPIKTNNLSEHSIFFIACSRCIGPSIESPAVLNPEYLVLISIRNGV